VWEWRRANRVTPVKRNDGTAVGVVRTVGKAKSLRPRGVYGSGL
jgi:hypothetical protein